MPQRLHSLIVEVEGEELTYQYMCREGDSVPPLAKFRKAARLSQLKELAEGLSRAIGPAWSMASFQSATTEIRACGGKLYDKVFPPELVESLAADPGESFVALYLDPELVWLPWELLWDGAEFLSNRFHVGRLLQKTGNEHRAAERRLRETRSGRGALIIFGDVSGLEARGEKSEIEKALSPVYGSNIWFYSTQSAGDVLEQLKQDYEICHFVGHGSYVEECPEKTGWVMADGTALTCGDVEGVSSRAAFPLLMFSNSCDSAHASFAEREGYVRTLYRAFLRQGVPQFIGSIAPIPDEPSKLFASLFYRMLAEGSSIGEALGRAKRTLAERAGIPVWPYYVHYGDPTYRLMAVPGTGEKTKAAPRVALSGLGRLSKEEITRVLEHYKSAIAQKPEDGEAHYGLAMCYLQLGLYDISVKNFKRTVELISECADAYYYYSLSLIRGRRPKTLTLNEVRLIEQYLETAIRLDDRPAKYYILAAILKFDYYLANGLLVRPPSPGELLRMAEERDYDAWEIERLLTLVPLRDEDFISRVRRNSRTSQV